MEKITQLKDAVKASSYDTVFKLLLSGVDVNAEVNDYNYQALHYAVDNLDKKMVDMLLHYGAKPNAKMLSIAGVAGAKDIVIKLLRHGANPNDELQYNQNVLHDMAYQKDRADICELFIKYGADVNRVSKVCRISPIWAAIDRRNNEVLEILLQYGANPLQEFDGPEGIRKKFPLQYAFDLPEQSVKSVVKYAALQIDSSDDQKQYAFLQLFSERSSKPYLKFAKGCLSAINILKERKFKDQDFSLFDFVNLQGDKLKTFLTDSDNVNQIFKYICFSLIPVYREVVLRKLDSEIIVNKIKGIALDKKLCVTSRGSGKTIFLNDVCFDCIFQYLLKSDLLNLYVAFE